MSKARAALAEMVAAAASSLALGGGRCWSARDWNPLKTKVSRCAPRNSLYLKKSLARCVPYCTILRPVMLMAPNSWTVESHLSSSTKPDMR